MTPKALRHDNITLEDSGPCDGCGKSFNVDDLFVLDEYKDDDGNTVINLYHPKCWEVASEEGK